MRGLAREQVEHSPARPFGTFGSFVRRVDPKMQNPIQRVRVIRHLLRAKVYGGQSRCFAFGSEPHQLKPGPDLNRSKGW